MPIGRRDLIQGGCATLALTFPGLAGTCIAASPVPQPFFANVLRILDALQRLGQPFPAADVATLRSLASAGTDIAVSEAQRLLDRYTLLDVTLGPSGYGRSSVGAAERVLVEQGWRAFLVRVSNPHGRTDRLYYDVDTPVLGQIEADSAARFAHERQGLQGDAVLLDTVARARLAILPFDDPPLVQPLSGLAVEYRLAQVIGFSPGRHSTAIMVGAFPAPQFVWAPAEKVRLQFEVVPARQVALRITDADGQATTASLVIRDAQRRIYPHKFGRLAPDMFFQDQIYRADGETLRLPDGRYRVAVGRGPEYLEQEIDLEVRAGIDPLSVTLRRWIDPAARGWYSGDVHIHAAGCAHYNDPTIGVAPTTMIRHVRGEGLWVGEVLTWGPGYQTQKRNFSGRAVSPPSALEAPSLQAANGTTLVPKPADTDRDSSLRYDVEVSGFPSSHSGHLILMQLADQDYPDTAGPVDWPSWSLPILQWAKGQGAVTGFAHCGLGLADLDDALPSLRVPSFDSIGANEFLVDVAHDAVDFLAGGSTIPAAELTLWYHALNCGFRTVFAGETDWPCMSDERVGAARTYVSLDAPPRGDGGYRAWVEGLRAGRVYMSDGRAHALAFEVGGAGPGATLKIQRGTAIDVEATIAARLDPTAAPELADIASRPSWIEPRWHLERARIADSRDVPAELIVNGAVVKRAVIGADGRPAAFKHRLLFDRSSWVAVRILPSLHTQPVFVEVDDAPVRASRESAQWCLDSLAVLERTQLPRIEAAERPAAAAAYAHARARFERIRAGCG